LVFVLGGCIEKLINDVIRGYAIAFSCEIDNDAVAKHRLGQRGDIFQRDVWSAMNESASLCAED